MSKLNFYIDGKKVDIDKNVDFTRIYRGLETTDTKKNNYSLTVKFPFTYNNDLIFRRTNSLTYKSNFPYEDHLCDVSSPSGVVLISKAVVKLLSTTDSYECAMTWANFDTIGAILNNPTKLGVFLESFPSLDWNYNHSLMPLTYDVDRTDSYGYNLYYDGGGNVGIYETNYFSYPHPLINFNYLLIAIFTELGITVNIPTIKNDFYQKLVIRPNKELDRYTNNVFEMYSSSVPFLYLPFFYATRFYSNPEDTGTSPRTPSFGNNSYYFKTWTDSVNGQDDFFINTSAIPQPYRFKCFATCYSTLTISNYIPSVSGDPVRLKRWSPVTSSWSYVFTLPTLGNGSWTFYAEEGDWFAFEMAFDVIQFKLTIDTNVDPAYREITTPLYFPSLFHIPTCIDMTVGEYIKQALDLTCSELTYDVNSDSYSFSERTKENGTAYDITKNITSIKEITYDEKYIYSKLGQENIFKYLNNTPIDADHNISVVNPNLVPSKTFVDLSFSPSDNYSGFALVGSEHTFIEGEIYTVFTEQPLHLLWHDVAGSQLYFSTDLMLENIFDLFWTNYWSDLISLALSGTVRLLKINTSITDIEFKRINTKGVVYIKTYGKYYSIIEVIKRGDFAEFFMLELY